MTQSTVAYIADPFFICTQTLNISDGKVEKYDPFLMTVILRIDPKIRSLDVSAN